MIWAIRSPQTTARLDRMIAAVFLVALGARAIYLREIVDAPFWDALMGDGRMYDAWAQTIAQGEWAGRGVFYQAPLYPYCLAVLYTIAGHSLLTVRLAQILLGSVGCAVLAAAGRRLFGPTAGFLAGLLLAIYPTAIFSDGLIQKSSLDCILMCLLLWVLSRCGLAKANGCRPAGEGGRTSANASGTHPPSRVWWLALGLTNALLTLTRENSIAIAPVLLYGALFAGREGMARQSIVNGALLVLGLVLVLAPVAVRNRFVSGEFHLTTAQFGPNLFIGNNPDADGSYMSLRPGRGDPAFEQTDATEIAEQAAARQLSPSQVSRYWTRRALEFVCHAPGAWLRLMGRKLLLMVNHVDLIDTDSETMYSRWSFVLTASSAVLGFAAICTAGVAGIWLTARRWRELWLLYAILIGYTISVAAFYVVARYRFPMVPLLALFAGAGMVEAARLCRQRRIGRICIAMGVAAATLGMTFLPIASAGQEKGSAAYTMGVLLLNARQDPQAALPYLQEATDLVPAFPDAHDALGVALASTGQLRQAIRSFEQALHWASDFHEARLHLARALADAGRTDDAIVQFQLLLRSQPNCAAIHDSLGLVLARNNRPVEAVEHYREALLLNPAGEATHVNLGLAFMQMGQLEPALREFDDALRIGPNNVSALVNRGCVLAQLDRRDEAMQSLARARNLRPDDPLIRGLVAEVGSPSSRGAGKPASSLETQP